MKRDRTGAWQDRDPKEPRGTNCALGLDADFGRKVCRNCGRRIMFVRRSRTARAHWQHVGDGLVQYRSW